MGRRLESATCPGGTKINYTYNADGLLTSKKKGSIEYYYYWNGDKLTAITDNGNTWHFRYDGDTPISLEFDGVEYFYVTNLQGDVIAILNDSGECVAEYEYDAWGNCTVTNDTDTIAYDNPLRYRGYYYDFDTKLYYLQSRFYDANTGRFINADEPTLIGANGGMVSNNLFAYCDNNPVMGVDPSGKFFVTATLVATVLICFAAILLCYSIAANYDSWVRFCTAVGNGLDSAWKSLKKGASSVWRWSKSKLKLLKAQLTTYLTAAKADAAIRTKVKRTSKTRYWSATLRKGYVDIGRRLTYSEAVKAVRNGKSVFTVTKAEAKALAKKASNNRKPVGPEIDKGKKGVVGYYYHYHTYNRNGAHIWYLY